jgi:hypothetical protein
MSPQWYTWIDDSRISLALRNSRVAVPIVETIHLLAIALAVGTIMMIDLSILGVGMRRQAVPKIARELAPLTWIGLGVAFATGLLLFWSEAAKISCKPVFWLKMALLAATFVFHLTVHRQATMPDPPMAEGRARMTAALSLTLWFAVAFGGKAVALF